METYSNILWQKDKAGSGARILRVYGNYPEIVLPDEIDGYPVTEIGDYCFSASEPRVRGDSYQTNPSSDTPAICGNFVQKVTLPLSVTTLHNAAFYNCRKLVSLSFGPGLTSIGSDEFTNCRELYHLTVRCSSHEETGLKTMLERIEKDVMVHFSTESTLFFPEYYEWLDEITPAHLFSRSINGEGYRMRKSFVGRAFSYDKYDQCFANAVATESDKVLCEIALWRLKYPVDLSEQAKIAYENVLKDNILLLSKRIASDKDSDLLSFIFSQFTLEKESLANILLVCSEADWPEGVTLTMEEQHRRIQSKPKTFSFDF